MHDPDVAPIVIAGTPVHEVLENEVSDIVSRMVTRHRELLTDYRRLPYEQLHTDVTSISQAAVSYYASWLREGRQPTPAELEHLGSSAMRRAEEGFPLESVLAAYVNGFEQIFRKLVEPAGPDDLAAVTTLSIRVFEFVRHAMQAVTSGYLDGLRPKLAQQNNAQRDQLSALLRADRSAHLMDPANAGFASYYLVLSLLLGAHPDEKEVGVNKAIVARRMLGRIMSALSQSTDDQALMSIGQTGGIVLVPLRDPDVDWDHWRRTLDAMSAAAGAPVTAAVAVAAATVVPSVAAEAADVLDVVRWFGKPPGLYRLDDVLVEYQLTRPGAARRQLASVLEPLDSYPELVTTLMSYVDAAFNRRRTATALHVHPNTVDYRLRRISELLDLDITQAPGSHRITAALAARRAERPR
ncbi:PucR family transcriptional regulator [Pseudonocardia sp. TRM90224]|uniref:PucR family transcriptional regulator n=1 Tax=Pseudonocardia sp. TRM90224 TaxID=2812678 RepID=UPI001E2CC946|nr:helix-turn-helix domain-containing protein [Pseudonocardia sp. TRM90224]